PGYQLEGELGFVPVAVDHRGNLGVDERPDPVPNVALGVGQLVLEQVVVGAAGAGEIGCHAISSRRTGRATRLPRASYSYQPLPVLRPSSPRSTFSATLRLGRSAGSPLSVKRACLV